MEKSTGGFDGEIVVINKDYYVMDQSSKAVVTSYGNNRVQVFNAKDLTAALAADLDVHELKKQGVVGPELRGAMKRARYLKGSLSVDTDSEIEELIWSGKIRVAFLLNSFGGDNELLDHFKDFMDAVGRRAGESSAYVTEVAASAAFDVVAEADRAFAVDDAVLAWHRTLDKETDEVVEEDKALDLEMLLDFFSRAKNPDHRRRLMNYAYAILNNPANPDALMEFFGWELAKVGCLEEGFSDVDAMRKHFSKRFWAADHELIGDFWKYSVYDGAR